MTHFGDMAWAARTGGRVGTYDKLAQLWAVVKMRVALALRGARELATGDIDRLVGEIELPTTPLVERAAALVVELGPPALTGHALRTWAWGAIFGARDGIAFDREALALASLLHDVALVRRTPQVTCFAADGASQAVRALADWGADDELQQLVGDAICMHVRVDVPLACGSIAHLVHAGAGLDVIGRRRGELAAELRDRVHARHPRGELTSCLVAAFEREHRDHRDSRMGQWVAMGFLDRIRAVE